MQDQQQFVINRETIMVCVQEVITVEYRDTTDEVIEEFSRVLMMVYSN
jgi:hypothetical protein